MFQNGACYIRVSTDDQTEYSPDAQLKAIKEYADKNGIILAKEHIYIDEGISGKRADKRPEFMRMIAVAKSHPKPFDIILVHKFDRFARSREDSVVYKSLLRKDAGIKVVSITESIEDDKFSVILEAMLEAMAEYYSLNLADEVKKGMTEKAHRGEYQTTAPYGYKLMDKKLIVLEDEANIIKFIFDVYASRKMNLSQIARHLNNLGVRTKRGNPIEYRTIEYILNNPVYVGKVRWTPTGKIRRNYNHPDSIIKDGTHQPLIDMDTWNKSQAIMKETKELYGSRQKSEAKLKTWLKGLVYCGNCGKVMVNSGYGSLQCNSYAKGVCRLSNHVKYKTLENLVLTELKNVFEGDIEIKVVPSPADDGANEYELLSVVLEKLDQKESRIKIAYQDGIDTLEEYKVNKEKISKERAAALDRLMSLQDSLLCGENDDNGMRTEIRTLYELLSDENIELQDKYRAAHFLINKITYSKTDKTLVLEYK